MAKKNLVVFSDDAYKSKESTIVYQIETEIEIEGLILSKPKNEVPTIPDIQLMMRVP